MFTKVFCLAILLIVVKQQRPNSIIYLFYQQIYRFILSTASLPITQYETVQELLQQSEEATKTVNQKYAINTFNLGVRMKALPLSSIFPGKFEEHVVILGPFHTEMTFSGIPTNHEMRGSGYAEIFEGVRFVTKGCITNVLNEEAFTKTLSGLKA